MKKVLRPGYFGRKRDERVAAYNKTYGEGKWQLQWFGFRTADVGVSFHEACRYFYEKSYTDYLACHPELLDEVCSYGECIDNAMTNIESGLDYTKQETPATHIQDIAVRNAIKKLGRKFNGDKNNILTIRDDKSNGYKFGPGNVPFFNPSVIEIPSLAPKWAKQWSVEDFWQSNKWLVVEEK
jgi:hypothetical protein